MSEFDFIVVGGGAAGCVVAARLSEAPLNRVLLIESVRRDKHRFIHIPATFFKVIEKGKDVHFYTSEPDAGLKGKGNIVPQGNVIGGGSSLKSHDLYPRSSQRLRHVGADGAAQLLL